MKYFVTLKNTEIKSNLTRIDAINIVKNLHKNNPNLGGLEIGIGKVKYIKGKKMHTHIPSFYYTD